MANVNVTFNPKEGKPFRMVADPNRNLYYYVTAMSNVLGDLPKSEDLRFLVNNVEINGQHRGRYVVPPDAVLTIWPR